jgi:hypothetical protein
VKKALMTMAIGAAILGQTGMAAYAEGGDAVQALTIPFRIVTSVAGAGVGLVAGGLQGVVDTEQKFAENTFGKASENAMLVPVGIVGAVVGVPVGFVMGAPKGMVDWGKKGYDMWDDMGK